MYEQSKKVELASLFLEGEVGFSGVELKWESKGRAEGREEEEERRESRIDSVIHLWGSKLTFELGKILPAKTSGMTTNETSHPQVKSVSERSCQRATKVKTATVERRARFDPPMGM